MIITGVKNSVNIQGKSHTIYFLKSHYVNRH